jgi:hypothetical protein
LNKEERVWKYCQPTKTKKVTDQAGMQALDEDELSQIAGGKSSVEEEPAPQPRVDISKCNKCLHS